MEFCVAQQEVSSPLLGYEQSHFNKKPNNHILSRFKGVGEIITYLLKVKGWFFSKQSFAKLISSIKISNHFTIRCNKESKPLTLLRLWTCICWHIWKFLEPNIHSFSNSDVKKLVLRQILGKKLWPEDLVYWVQITESATWSMRVNSVETSRLKTHAQFFSKHQELFYKWAISVFN